MEGEWRVGEGREGRCGGGREVEGELSGAINQSLVLTDVRRTRKGKSSQKKRRENKRQSELTRRVGKKLYNDKRLSVEDWKKKR